MRVQYLSFDDLSFIGGKLGIQISINLSDKGKYMIFILSFLE